MDAICLRTYHWPNCAAHPLLTGESSEPTRFAYTHPVQTADELNTIYALPGTLAFDEPHPGMPRLRVTTPACTAELYLHGAHLTGWQPAGTDPVLFLSDRSAYTPRKAIRGGVPVIFPWFGAPNRSPVHPPAGSASHGFARVSPWTLQFAALAGDDLHLSLTLDQTESLGTLDLGSFQLACELILGQTLTVRLSVANTGDAPFLFEEALHAYFHVGDSRQVSIEGLTGTDYLDKTENFARKQETAPALRFHGETDRPYLNTTSPLTLIDPALKRKLQITKTGSETTVVWNPGPALTATLPDLAPDAWQGFACIETANVGENALTLRPREAHTVGMHVAVQPL